MAPVEPHIVVPDAAGQALRIEVVVGLASGRVSRHQVSLSAGSTVKQALDAAQIWALSDTLNLNGIESGEWTVGVWGRKERLTHVLRDQDRIELVRPLIVDPKEARRVRYKAHSDKQPKPAHIQRSKAR